MIPVVIMEMAARDLRMVFQFHFAPFLTDTGYQKFLESQERGEVKLKNHAKVSGGHLHYDHRDHAL